MSFDEKTLLERLDKLFDEDKFAEIEREIVTLPREELSLELRFRLVSALNNQKKLAEAMNELRSTGLLTLDINGNKVELSEEDLLIETAQTEGYVTEADGDISVVLDTNLTPELIEEGFVREIVSKVQTMRKEAGFEVMDKIHIYAKDNDKILELMKNHKEEIMSEVLAEDMTLGTTDGYVKEWNINKEPVVLGVAKM